MADGTFAVLTLILGLFDMSRNYCGTEAGCYGRSETTPRLAISGGQVLERRAKPAGEVYLRYDMPFRKGPFGTAAGISVGEKGETWFGIGHTYTLKMRNSPFFAELHTMPGVYFAGDGFDLGGLIEFRSGIELGYENRRGWRFGLSYDHRSNAGIYDDNPGIETVMFRINVPTE